MRRRASWVSWLLDPEPPGLGLDLRSAEMSLVRIAVKRGKPQIDLSVTSPLPAGCLHFQMLEPNILDPKALAQAIDNVLLRSGAADSKRLALTLPDYLSRISVVELPETPRSTAETLDVLKFSLRKSLPFDVDEARVAFEHLPKAASGKPVYLAGVMHEAVVSQYENFLRELGFHVGLVLPASVSLLQVLRPHAERNLAPGADYFFVNVEREYFSITLVRDRAFPAFTRTLGLRATKGPAVAYSEEDFLQEIIPTAIYYREKLGGSALERIYYRSLRPDLAHVREILEEQLEAPSEPFNLMRVFGTTPELKIDAALADAVGAAAGAAFGRAS